MAYEDLINELNNKDFIMHEALESPFTQESVYLDFRLRVANPKLFLSWLYAGRLESEFGDIEDTEEVFERFEDIYNYDVDVNDIGLTCEPAGLSE